MHITAERERQREMVSGNRVKGKANRKGSLVVRQNGERPHRAVIHCYQAQQNTYTLIQHLKSPDSINRYADQIINAPVWGKPDLSLGIVACLTAFRKISTPPR